jgi:hypothetical protein
VVVLQHPGLELPKLLHAGVGVHGHVCVHGPTGLLPQQQPPRGEPSAGWIGGSTSFLKHKRGGKNFTHITRQHTYESETSMKISLFITYTQQEEA